MARPHADSGEIPPISASIAAMAARQHGVVARRQLLELGMPPRTLNDWVRAGRLHRLHRGVYAVGHRFIGTDGHRMAAVLFAGPGSALSHWAAADLTAIMRVDERQIIHVSRPTTSGADPPGIVLHRVPDLATDLTTHRGIPTTTAARTIFDLTPFLSALALGRAIERAEYLGILDRTRLRQLANGAQGHRGVSGLREVLGEPAMPLDRVRSGLEVLLLRICREHALPTPSVNVPLLGYEVDFLWQAERFVVEADGGDHKGPRRDRDNERDVALARAGYLVRRYSEAALSKPEQVAVEVPEILAERRPG